VVGDEFVPQVLMRCLDHDWSESGGVGRGSRGAVVRGFAEKCWKHFEMEDQGRERVEGHAGDDESMSMRSWGIESTL